MFSLSQKSYDYLSIISANGTEQTFSGKEVIEPIVYQQVEDTFVVIHFKADSSKTRSGFKISFATSFDPGMLMDLTEIEYLDELRIFIQDVYHDMLKNNAQQSIWPFKEGNLATLCRPFCKELLNKWEYLCF